MNTRFDLCTDEIFKNGVAFPQKMGYSILMHTISCMCLEFEGKYMGIVNIG